MHHAERRIKPAAHKKTAPASQQLFVDNLEPSFLMFETCHLVYHANDRVPLMHLGSLQRKPIDSAPSWYGCKIIDAVPSLKALIDDYAGHRITVPIADTVPSRAPTRQSDG